MYHYTTQTKKMNYKYSLDKSSKKYICPDCGKKRFVRYIDNSTNLLTSLEFGRCDRYQSCGYHMKPELNIHIESHHLHKTPLKPSKSIHFLPTKTVIPTLGLQHSNNLVDFLFRQYENGKTKEILRDYKVGTSKKWNGATIFWQIDSNQKIRSGKIIHYNPENGKRIKEPFPRISWVHKEIEKLNKLPKDYELKQCLFGEHLLTKPSYSNKIVAIVESEKTAMIMAINYPKYLWLSCGSLNGIKTTLFTPIKNKRVVLFPDKECFDLWTEKATTLNKDGFNIQVSSLIEGLNIKKGLDLADLFTPSIDNTHENNTSNNEVVKEKTIYDTNGNQVKLTPELKYLIVKLGLENE